MPKIHEIRENVDRKLDKLETKATVIESQLNETRESTISRIESQKQAYREKLKRLREEVEKSKELAAEKKGELVAVIDHAEVQLALGKAEARDAVDDQRKKIGRAVAEMEAKIDLEFEQADEEMKAALVAAADSLDAEMEAAAIRLDAKLEAAADRLEKENIPLDEKLAQTKGEINSQIDAYKKDITAKRQVASEKWSQFEGELDAGLDKVTTAFKKLFS